MPNQVGQLTSKQWDTLLKPISGLTTKQRYQLKKAWALRWSCLQEQQQPMANAEQRFEHGLDLFRLLLRMHVDIDAVVAGLLVEPVKQELLLLEEVTEKAGEEVATLCKQITSLPEFEINEDSAQKEQRPRRRSQIIKAQAEIFRRMLLAMSQDLRVVLVLLVVRLHQMRVLAYIPVSQHLQIARECREIYVPLANRLGISWVKHELEDATFRYLFPHDFYGLVSLVNATQIQRKEYIEEVQVLLRDLLTEHDIPGQVMGRPKHLNSIFRKMIHRRISYEELYDIIAFRIICQTKGQCYQILGLIHDTWKPIPGRFKDYIALPKSNMYQSLHTTVVGPHKKRMEVQIRTQEMHLIAEDGIAAHWLYKESGGSSGAQAAGNVQWLRSLLQLQDEKADEDAFVANVRDHLFESKVFVFTPRGDIRELRRGSTPLDFAFAIHTEVGLQCTGAKVNNKMVSLRYELHNGDICEILTSPSACPNSGWLDLAQSARAKNKIRAFLRTEQREQAIQDGRERLERTLPAGQRNVSRLRKNGDLDKVSERLGLTTVEELLAQIGYGKVSAENVVRILFPREQKSSPSPTPKKSRRSSIRPSSGGVLVEGLDDIMIRMARCCHPIPGDPIVGFISRGRGVIVHRKDCSRLRKAEIQRQIDVRWTEDDVNLHSVNLRIITENRPTLLSQISQVFDNLNIQISRANYRSVGDESSNLFRCHISNVQQLQQLIRQISDIRGVIAIKRLRN